MFVEFRTIIYLKISLDLNIVLKKNGNEAHSKSTKQMQKLVCMGKGEGVPQQNSFASTSFFHAFRILNEGFQNSNLLKTLNKAPIVKTQAR